MDQLTIFASEHHCGRAVVDAGGIARSYGSVLGKGRLETRQLVDARFPHVFIKVKVAYGDQFFGLDVFCLRRRGAAL